MPGADLMARRKKFNPEATPVHGEGVRAQPEKFLFIGHEINDAGKSGEHLAR